MRYTLVNEVAQGLLNCVCDSLTEARADLGDEHPGCPCWVGVTPGRPTLDCPARCSRDEEHHPGKLAVWVSRVFRTTDFPAESVVSDPCQGSKLVAEYGVTLMRCVPTIDARGNLPTADDFAPSAELLAVDYLAMERAVTCCLPEVFKRARVVVTSHSTLNPEGGCAGSEMRVLVQLGSLCCEVTP